MNGPSKKILLQFLASTQFSLITVFPYQLSVKMQMKLQENHLGQSLLYYANAFALLSCSGNLVSPNTWLFPPNHLNRIIEIIHLVFVIFLLKLFWGY